MPTSLVTGAAGFIGSHVTEQLLHAGHTVIAVDDLSGGRIDNIPADADFIRCSITDAGHIRWLFDEVKPKYVFHLAAYAAEGLSHFIRRFNYTNNVVGSVNLVNEAVRCGSVDRFVFTSSMAVYGSGQVPMTEQLTPKPEDPYGIAKYAVELDLAAAHDLFGLDYTVFRPHNVYGERQNVGDRYRNVIGIFCNQIMRGEAMTIFGDGQQTRAFSYIADVAPTIARCIDVPLSANRTFNIGADQPYTILELAKTVAWAFGVDAKVEHMPTRHEVLHAWTAHDELHRVFGEKWPVPLRVGLKAMVEWAKLSGPQPTPQFDGIELTAGLPAVWTDSGR